MADFILGFKALADLIPHIVGIPVENERHDPESGDGLQQTILPSGHAGLMVWRKADNWTAFTDGYRTWINGPLGLQERLNTERFDWEREVSSPIAEVWDSPNRWPGRPYGPPIAIVLHTMGGWEAGMEAVAMSPASEVSAHFGVMLDGRIAQYVPLQDRAWHCGILQRGNRWAEVYRGPWDGRTENPNNHTVGIETEDGADPGQWVTDAQYLGTHGACRLAMATYPSIRWLLGHDEITPLSRPNCPGRRWRAGRFGDLARDLGLRMLS